MDASILQRSYNQFARRYDEIFSVHQRPKIEALRAALPAELPGPILDAGAGTGLLARLSGDRVVAVDLAVDMLRQANDPRVLATMRQLPFVDHAFGTVFAVTSLLDFGPTLTEIDELARVLRPGGYFAVSVLKIENVAALEHAVDRVGWRVERRHDLMQDIGFTGRAKKL